MASNQQPASIQQIIDRSDWRRQLAADYADTAARLQRAYGRILPNLQSAANGVNTRIIDWTNANPDDRISAADVQGFKQFQDLLKRVEIEMKDFAVLVRNEAGGLQDKAIVTGLDGALEMAVDTSGNLATIVQAMWNRPSPEALKTLIGYVDGDAFRQKASVFGEKAAQNIADVVLSGVAQGMNPRAIARLTSSWFDIPYSWAENSTRTVQLYSNRAANQASYMTNPDVLNGWIWIAALGDSRTCMSCISQHGSKHTLDEVLSDHHQGRCTPAPWVKGTTWPDIIVSGPNWFDAQPESYQRGQMGGALFNAWKAGAMQWSDMSEPYEDDVYGIMLREASVSGTLGVEQAKQYYVRNQRAS